MQLFISDEDLYGAALNLDNRRLNKQIIEGCQILSTALWMNNCDVAESLYKAGEIYLPTHEHHPVVKWCAMSRGNYAKTIRFIRACLVTYKKEHKCGCMLINFMLYMGLIKAGEFTGWQNFTSNHKHIENVYEAYKQCLKEKYYDTKN